MEKLSHIVKGRTNSSVDLSKERPVRAGAPSFGQTVSHSTHVYEAPEPDPRKVAEESRQAEIVDKVNFSFKKPELAEAVKSNDEAREEHVQDSVSSQAQEKVGQTPNSYTDENGQKHVNLSIYV